MISKFRFIWVIILIVFIVYGIFASPITINKKLSAVKYRLGDKGFTENITIKIEGKYSRKLFSSDIFVGTIYIEGYEFTNDSSRFSNLKSPLTNIHFGNNGYGRYSYIKLNSQEQLQTLMQGDIFIKNKFAKLTMTIMEKDSRDNFISGWNSENGLMISAPAETRQEALNISNLLMTYYNKPLK